MFQVMLVSTLFAITKFFELVFNFRKINIKNKSIIVYLMFGLFFWFLIQYFYIEKRNSLFTFTTAYVNMYLVKIGNSF